MLIFEVMKNAATVKRQGTCEYGYSTCVAKASAIWNYPWQQEARNRKDAVVVELRLVSFLSRWLP